MLSRVVDVLERIITTGLWIGFLALLLTVGFQVAARNILRLPVIWTPDVAQLLFSWLIFIGAAVAFRRGAHYLVDLWPEDRPLVSMMLQTVTVVTSAVVIYILVRYGFVLVGIRQTSTVQSLGISRSWMYLPIPLSGVLMGLFLVEQVVTRFAQARR